MTIDLRSDTVTRPSKRMKEAMFTAPVGDDVFEEDPTVIALENKAAQMFGMQAAIFCPSGTMTNQIAIRLHTHIGAEVICDKSSHIYNYEGGGVAVNSNSSIRLLDGDRGRFTAKQVAQNINPDDIHFPVTTMVAVENTCNRGGGCFYDFKELKAISTLCMGKDLKFHLDGARLFNALVETEETAKDYGPVFDTISICLSKGLGAPIGSLLLGSKRDIKRARRIRKVLGGGMRQVGFLAAAGIYALDNNINRLQEDHKRAKKIEKSLNKCSFVKQVIPVNTNIVVFELNSNVNPQDFIASLNKKDVKVVAFGQQLIRMVTHLDFDDNQLEKLELILKKLQIS